MRVNEELLKLYWDIEKIILEKQEQEGWGKKIVDRRAKDLKESLPRMSGFSPRNLSYMRQFAEAYPEESILQQLAEKFHFLGICFCSLGFQTSLSKTPRKAEFLCEPAVYKYSKSGRCVR